MEQNEYLKIKEKYEAVLIELMKEVSNQLDYDDCNLLFKEMSLSLLCASLDFDNLSYDEINEELVDFMSVMFISVFDTIRDIKNDKFEGVVIKHYE